MPPPPRSLHDKHTLKLWQRLTRPLVRWYARLGLPRSGWLLHYWGMNRAQDFKNAPIVEIKEKWHGHRIRLDLADFFQRCGYFMSSYHEKDVLCVLDHGLRAGDHVVDGGANIGLVTLFAAGKVGPTGRVDTFEPSPELLPTLRWHISENKLSQVVLHEAGISDEPATLTMSIPSLDNTGAGTLGALPPRYGQNTREVGTVTTVRGDDVLDASTDAPLLVKLDIEGFEFKAMQGMAETIRRRRPAILCEMLDEMLALNGASSRSILEFLHPMGYHPFGLDRKGWRGGHKLHLHPLLGNHLRFEKDVFWLHPESTMWERYAGCMQQPGQYWRHHQLQAAGLKAARGG